MWSSNLLKSLITSFSGIVRSRKNPSEVEREVWEGDKDSGAKFELEMKSKPHPPEYVKADGGYPEKQPKVGNLD